MPNSTLRQRYQPLLDLISQGRAVGLYPFFRTITSTRGGEVEVDGRWCVTVASNDYLGLAHHERVRESAAQAARRWGTSEGGSRFLCGNLSLFEELEGSLAAFLGKKRVVVHSTGFSANLGVIACLATPQDYILCDRHGHASILAGCQASGARLVPFAHNDPANAAGRLARARAKDPQGQPFLISEGVFSMQGDLSPLPGLLALKDQDPRLLVYLDDAHGLGLMGPGGRGTAAHYGLSAQTDLIMGTFSKSLASIGGFVAGDDEALMDYLRHQSRTLIFSAALPAPNLAAALTALTILQEEPERVERLWQLAGRVREGFSQMGLDTGASCTPIIPVVVGDDVLAALVSRDLLQAGVFAPPAIFPAVPKGRAVIRVAVKATHSDEQVERLLTAMAQAAQRHGLHLPPQERPSPKLFG